MYRQSILSPNGRPKHEAYHSLKEQLQQQTAKLLRQRQNLNEINSKNKKFRVPTQQTIIQQSGLTSNARLEYLEQLELRRYKQKVKRICKKIEELIAICGNDQEYQDIVESQKFILDFLFQFFNRLQNSSKNKIGFDNQSQIKDSERTNIIKITQKQFIDENVAEIINEIQNKVFHQINVLKEENRSLLKKITEEQMGSHYQRNKCLELQQKIYNLSSLLDVRTRRVPAITFSRIPNTRLSQSSEFIIPSPQIPQSNRRDNHYVLSKKNDAVHNQRKLYSFKNPEIISQFHIQDFKKNQNLYKSPEPKQIQENRFQDYSKGTKNAYFPQEFYRSKIEDLKFEDQDGTNDMQKLAKVRSHPGTYLKDIDFRTTVETNSLSQNVNQKQRKCFMGRANEQKKTEQKARHSQISWPALNRFDVTLNTYKRYSTVKQ